ncbi:MAG: hypothetical protein ACFFCO_11865 [Promethearchaeota archaeon]
MLKCESCGKDLDADQVPRELTYQVTKTRRQSVLEQHQSIRIIYYFCSPKCMNYFLTTEMPRFWCPVCDKLIQELKEDLIYRTRIDRRLPGETSHFKHIHVTYYFCSPECREKFFSPEEDAIFPDD